MNERSREYVLITMLGGRILHRLFCFYNTIARNSCCACKTFVAEQTSDMQFSERPLLFPLKIVTGHRSLASPLLRVPDFAFSFLTANQPNSGTIWPPRAVLELKDEAGVDERIEARQV
jgi:hypothetical protein